MEEIENMTPPPFFNEATTPKETRLILETTEILHNQEIPRVAEVFFNHKQMRSIILGAEIQAKSPVFLWGSLRINALNKNGLPIRQNSEGNTEINDDKVNDIDLIVDMPPKDFAAYREVLMLAKEPGWKIDEKSDPSRPYERIDIYKMQGNGTGVRKITIHNTTDSANYDDAPTGREERLNARFSDTLYFNEKAAIVLKYNPSKQSADAHLFDPFGIVVKPSVHARRGIQPELRIDTKSAYYQIITALSRSDADALKEFSQMQIALALEAFPRAMKYRTEEQQVSTATEVAILIGIAKHIAYSGYPEFLPEGKKEKFYQQCAEAAGKIMVYPDPRKRANKMDSITQLTVSYGMAWLLNSELGEKFEQLEGLDHFSVGAHNDHLPAQAISGLDFMYNGDPMTNAGIKSLRALQRYAVLEDLALHTPGITGIDSINTYTAMLIAADLLQNFIFDANTAKTPANYEEALKRGISLAERVCENSPWVGCGNIELDPPEYLYRVLRQPGTDANPHVRMWSETVEEDGTIPSRSFDTQLSLDEIEKKLRRGLAWRLVEPMIVSSDKIFVDSPTIVRGLFKEHHPMYESRGQRAKIMMPITSALMEA